MPIQGGYKNLRLKDFDYHNGWFFVTNKTDFARNYLTGDIRRLVKGELMNLVKNTNGVGLDYFHLMPNHLHAILIFNNATIALPEFWRRFKAITTFKAKRVGFQEKTLWQRNYFEHIVRNDKALDKIREYIENNPLKEDLPLVEFYEEVNIPIE